MSDNGRSPLAWAAIGCAALAVLVLVSMFCVCGTCGFVAQQAANEIESQVKEFENNPVRTAAEVITRFNPDLELVSANEETGEVQIKNLETNETVSINYEDLKAGKLQWSTTNAEGETTTASASMEGGKGLTVTGAEGNTVSMFGGETNTSFVPVHSSAQGDPQQIMAASSPEEDTGMFSYTSSEDPGALLDYYADYFDEQGFEVTRQMFGDQGIVSASNKSTGDTASVNVTGSGGEITVTATYKDVK